MMKGVEMLLDSTRIQIKDAPSDHLITSSRAWLEVGDVMSANVTTVSSDETVVSAVKTMSGNKISCIVVVDHAKVVGILTETDILKRIAGRDSDFDKRSVAEIMSSPVETVPRDLSVLEAAEISEKRHIKRLPVLENKRLVGLVTQTDIVRTMTSCGVWKDVADIMSRNVAVVQKTATVAEAAQVMTSRNISCVVALEGDEVVGILTERDLLSKIVARHRDPTLATMEEVMSSPVATVPPDHSVFSASRTMEAKGVRRLVVMEGERLCGVVAQTDIFRAAKRKLDEAERENLRLLGQSENNVYTSDLDGKTTYVNPAFLRLFEVPDPGEFIGQPFLPERFWLDPKDRLRVLPELRKGNVDIEELTLKTSKGKRIHVMLFSASTRNARGELNGTQGILYDVTEKKELVALREAKEALRESERRFMDVLHTSDDAILLIDGDTFVDCNEATARMLGYCDREELLMTHPSELSPPSQRDGMNSFEKANEMIRTALEKGFHRFEWMHRKADGEDFPVEVSLTPIPYQGRTILHCLWRDLTDRNRAAEQLLRSETKFRTLYDSTSDAVMLLDEKGFFDCNDATVRIFGCKDKAEFRTKHPADLSPAEQPCGTSSLNLANRRIATAMKNGRNQFDWMHKKLDTGKTFPAEVLLNALELDGRSVLQAVVRDITDRKRAEEALLESEERFRRFAMASGYGFSMGELSGQLLFANAAALRIAEENSEEAFTNKTFYQYYTPKDAERLKQQILPIVLEKGRWVGEVPLLSARGNLIATEQNIFLIRDEQGTPRMVGNIITDITERKQSEVELAKTRDKAEAANRAKSEFLANMSHEIRTPMTAILGFSHMLAESVTEPEQLAAATTIKQNGEYLTGIINDILDLSKIEAGMLEVERIECSPCRILSEVISLMRVRAQAKDLPLEIEYDGPIPQTIQSDPTRLRQMLINLTGNAIKFTEVGKVRLVVRLLDAESDEPTVQFEVVDSGIGMTEEQIVGLFRPFHQADTSTTRKFGGTGLGLAISKRLAEKLGGDIVVKSTLGEGSTFTVTVETGPLDGVKLADNPTDAPVGTDPDKKPTAPKTKLGGRVLLAEDGPDNQRLISSLLKKAGTEVAMAENGQIAHDLALAARDEGAPFDVILMDMQMPVMDGYDATSKLRETGYSGPIIALTAHAMNTDRDKCLAAGCDDYMAKPIDHEKLISLIAEYASQETRQSTR